MGNGYRQNMDKSLKLALIVSFIMSLLLIYPCSVGIMGTETRQISTTEQERTTFIQEPYFGTRLEIGREIQSESAAGGEIGAEIDDGRTVEKIDSQTGIPIENAILDAQPMTLWEAISMGLPVMDFVKRFVLPGVIPAILFGFIIGGIVPVWPILVGKQIAE